MDIGSLSIRDLLLAPPGILTSGNLKIYKPHTRTFLRGPYNCQVLNNSNRGVYTCTEDEVRLKNHYSYIMDQLESEWVESKRKWDEYQRDWYCRCRTARQWHLQQSALLHTWRLTNTDKARFDTIKTQATVGVQTDDSLSISTTLSTA